MHNALSNPKAFGNVAKGIGKKERKSTFVVALEDYHLVAFDHQFRGEIVGDQVVEYEMEILPSPVVRDEGGVDVDFFKKRPFAKI